MAGVDEVGSAAGLLLASLFAWAGAVKLVSPARTTASFRALGLPAAHAFARLVPLVELTTAASILIAPRLGGVLALGLLTLFSGVVATALATGRRTGCGCFGATSTDDELSGTELIRNAALALGAAAVLLTPRIGVPDAAATVLVGSAAVVAALALGLLRMRHRLGTVWATPLPGTFGPR